MNPRTKHAIFFLFTALLVVSAFAISSYAKQASKGKKGGQIVGWCYAKGKIIKSTSSYCREHKGHFFKDRNSAKAYLDAQTKGWCCADRKVTNITKGNCKIRGGKFFTTQNDANDYCDAQTPGYCCLDGKVSRMTKGGCQDKGGKFFTGREKAAAACKGWCLFNGRIFETTRKICLTRRGRFFTKKAEAQKALRQATQKQKPSSGPGTSGKSTLSPLLSVEKIFLRNGTIYVRVKNKGKGKFTRKHYDKGRLILSFGAKNKTWTLGKVDPRGALTPGKSVDFDTGLKLTRRARIKTSFSNLPGEAKKTALLIPVASRSSALQIMPTVKTDYFKRKIAPSQQSNKALQNSRMTTERRVAGSNAGMTAQAPSLPEPGFPARITSVNHPVAVGGNLSIYGHDFGRNEGHVVIALPDATFSCEITEWTQGRVRCIVPISMGEAIGRSAKETVIWLKPARVEPPAPGTFIASGPGGPSETPYYYSGEEGPRYVCTIQPMVPRIDRLSKREISPLQELTIRGRNFGDSPGQLTFSVPGDRYAYRVNIISWNNTRIRMQLSDTMDDPYGDPTDRLYAGENRPAEITVTNSSGNNDAAGITFTPGDESEHPEIDIHTSHVRISRRTVSGQRQLVIQITVENREAGTTWRRIRIDLRGLDMAGWIEDGIGGHQEKIYTFIYNDSHRGDDLDFHVILDQHNKIPETSTSNNDCHITWRAIDREREYSCLTL